VSARLRVAAERDVDGAVTYYRDEAGPDVALEFIDALEAAISQVSTHPLMGSLRFAFELDIPELRSWRLQRFPYLIFYVSDGDDVDIWRVLHTRRNIPEHLVDT
jgi:toxin ParE1/3/4